jgi:hypothetical protein
VRSNKKSNWLARRLCSAAPAPGFSRRVGGELLDKNDQ